MGIEAQNRAYLSEAIEEINKNSDYYGSALAKFIVVLTQENEKYLHSAHLKFGEKENISEIKDYETFMFVTKTLSVNDAIEFLNGLSEGIVKVKDLDCKLNEGRYKPLEFVPSKKDQWGVILDWAHYLLQYEFSSTRSPVYERPIVKKDLPIYPDFNRACSDFLNVTIWNFRGINVFIPDLRARIANLIISGSKIVVEVDSRINFEDLRVKIYAESEKSRAGYGEGDNETVHSLPLKIENSEVIYHFDKEPKYILTTLIDVNSGNLIDYREYGFGWRSREGITIKLEELEIMEIIRRGENINVEYKVTMDNTDRILDTIVAFANTQGGRILVGVSDDAQIIGYPPDITEKIRSLIRVHIDPQPKVHVDRVEIGEKWINIIEVFEGDNKPYSHRERGICIRSNATNRRATRTDLDTIYRKGKFPRLR